MFRKLKARTRVARAHVEILTRRAKSRAHSLRTPLIVSLTSYPARYGTLGWTLRSLLFQTIRPDATVLWIDKEYESQLPADVLALQAKGLTIGLGEGLRSYNKIIPALRAYPNSTIVTADDDVHYPSGWLEGLVNESSSGPVICHRAHKVALGATMTPLPYSDWQWKIEGPDASPLVFPTGVLGVLYEPGAFYSDVLRSELFTELCPDADDIWLYWMFRLHGKMAYKTSSMIPIFEWPGSQATNLRRKNIRGNGNDEAIAAMVRRYGFPGWT